MSWLPGWDKRIKLTVDNGDIDGLLENFPILVYLSTSSGRNSTDVSCVFDELASDANRKKIAVTTSDGLTQCYVEIEKWDDANEQAWLWVKAPSVASGADTELYFYYDSKKADNDTYVGDTNSTPAENVWDEWFEAVFHMADGADNQHIYDSTNHNNDGTKGGANEPLEVVSAIVSRAQRYDPAGIGDVIQSASAVSLATNFTVEMVVLRNGDSGGGSSTWHHLLQHFGGDGGANVDSFYLAMDGTYARVSFKTNTAQYNFQMSVMNPAITHHLVAKYDGANATECIDGMSSSLGAANGVLQTGATKLEIGRQNDYQCNCDISEVRISSVARSDAWNKATYETLWDDLLAFGAEEDVPLVNAVWDFFTWG